MVRRIMRTILVALVVIIAFLVIYIKLVFTWTLLPTKSYPKALSITTCYAIVEGKPVITLRHFINGTHVADYVLALESGLHIEEPQKYDMPKFEAGTIEISIITKNWRDEFHSEICSKSYQAGDLYKYGLCIYFNEARIKEPSDPTYVYFISGKNEICYYQEVGTSEWVLTTEAPPLIRFTRNEPMPFISIYSGWKENEWVVIEADQ